jgi:hypothetical protein
VNEGDNLLGRVAALLADLRNWRSGEDSVASNGSPTVRPDSPISIQSAAPPSVAHPAEPTNPDAQILALEDLLSQIKLLRAARQRRASEPKQEALQVIVDDLQRLLDLRGKSDAHQTALLGVLLNNQNELRAQLSEVRHWCMRVALRGGNT